MKPGWRRVFCRSTLSCSWSENLKWAESMAGTRHARHARHEAQGTADGMTWAQGRPCCISSAELSNVKTKRPDRTSEPVSTRVRTWDRELTYQGTYDVWAR